MKNDIKNIPFNILAEELLEGYSSESTTTFIDKHDLGLKHSWVFPQVIATFGSWKAIPSGDGYYDPKATVKHNIKDNMWMRGLWNFAMSKRSIILDSTKTKAKAYNLGSYNHLVPIILAGFRGSQNIPYSKWGKENLHYIVDIELCEAMRCTPNLWSTDELLKFRDIGLTGKTGRLAGVTKDPRTAYSINKVGDIDFDSLPRLAKIMLTQIWLAHPDNRSHHQVLQPIDWDAIPSALVSSGIGITKKTSIKDIWDI